MKWYKEKWHRGHVLENSQAKLILDLEFSLWKTTTSTRPDLMLEEKQIKTIWISDMACWQENNIEKKRLEKRTTYTQLAFKIRERRPEFKIKVVLLVISGFWWRYSRCIIRTRKDVWKRWFVQKDCGRNTGKYFGGQWDYHSKSAVRTCPKRLKKLMIITALFKRLTYYLEVSQSDYMIWIGSIAITFRIVIIIMHTQNTEYDFTVPRN